MSSRLPPTYVAVLRSALVQWADNWTLPSRSGPALYAEADGILWLALGAPCLRDQKWAGMPAGAAPWPSRGAAGRLVATPRPAAPAMSPAVVGDPAEVNGE